MSPIQVCSMASGLLGWQMLSCPKRIDLLTFRFLLFGLVLVKRHQKLITLYLWVLWASENGAFRARRPDFSIGSDPGGIKLIQSVLKYPQPMTWLFDNFLHFCLIIVVWLNSKSTENR